MNQQTITPLKQTKKKKNYAIMALYNFFTGETSKYSYYDHSARNIFSKPCQRPNGARTDFWDVILYTRMDQFSSASNVS